MCLIVLPHGDVGIVIMARLFGRQMVGSVLGVIAESTTR
jgi:hypothetical protein